ARNVIAVDDVVELAAPRIPESLAKRPASALGELPPSRIAATGDLERVDPQRLDLDGLADPGRDHVALDAPLHPRQLHPTRAARPARRTRGGHRYPRGCDAAYRSRSRRRSPRPRRRARAGRRA